MNGSATAVLVVTLAALACALALAVSRSRRVSRRFRMLEEVARVSDAGDSLQRTLEGIAGVLVPQIADVCMVDVIAEGRPRRAIVRVGPGAPPGAQDGLQRRRPRVPGWMGHGGASSFEPLLFDQSSGTDLRSFADDEEFEGLRRLGVRSAITLALRARRQLTGTLTLGVAWSGRRYRADDVAFARVLAGRIALALDNAGLFSDLERAERARAEIAATLQRGLMPPPLPRMRGWLAAAMYRPAGAENEVGGDFYDAFPVAGGWMLVIGDVTGRGARAASVTAQARYTLRAAAQLSGDPLVALATLNHTLLAREDQALCTVAALALEEDPRRPVRLAVAGHPPPLVVDGEAVTEVAGAGPLLGAVADASWPIVKTTLAPGQQLVVITDGVTEAGGREGRFGEARLRGELAGATSPAQAVRRLEGALDSFTGGVLDDDAAILAIAPVVESGNV